ncbi:MAG: tRNA-intron lyase, partial [candidate division WOR-3 bacterium]
RGLFIRPESEARGKYGKAVVRNYGRGTLPLYVPSLEGVFFEDALISTLDNYDAGKELYEKYWFGQLGTYKAPHRGAIAKLDALETLFLMDRGKLSLLNSSRKKAYAAASKRIGYFADLYKVYSDWREGGYVVKSGFKFGTHFRIYLPGAGPLKGGEWVHSRHVLHVFPRKCKMLISEWARAIRVAHSVKKTFILAIPGKGKSKKGRVDFALYHRKGLAVETPKEDDPSYLMLALSEDEYLSGEELASALKASEERGLDLLLGIADRETSVTYYLIRRIKLPGSEYEYYEIEWMQP